MPRHLGTSRVAPNLRAGVASDGGTRILPGRGVIADELVEAAARWLEATVASDETIGMPARHGARVPPDLDHSEGLRRPLMTTEAIARLEALRARSNVLAVEPAAGHWLRLEQMAVTGQATGSLLPDAHIATLAAEHGAALATTDRDFRRFDDVRSIDPLG